MAAEKEEGPTTRIMILGIQIDTVKGVLTLPDEKLLRIQQELICWDGRRWCKRRELESLIGLLHHVAQVVRPGRSFLHWLISHLQMDVTVTTIYGSIRRQGLSSSGGVSSWTLGI